jgi:extradiol dioxygenase family protein
LEQAPYEAFLQRLRRSGVRFFCEPFCRFSGLREEHTSFVIVDPSNNLLEFKYYLDPAMAY